MAASQKQRLELALSSGRMWKKEEWVELFTKKPVMHPFAIGLIWGIYKEETLTGSFRYMEDGSFNTVDEEELELPEDAVIGLIHPIELSRKRGTHGRSSWRIMKSFSLWNSWTALCTSFPKKKWGRRQWSALKE